MTILANARLVLPDRVVPGWLRTEGDRIASLGEGVPPDDLPAGDERRDLAGAYLLPGLVDLHCHGGGGAAFTAGDEAQARDAAAFHLRHGTTTMLASLVTAAVDDLVAHARVLGRLAGEGVVAGVHFEGPFLSAKRCGAQDPAYLRDPDAATFGRLVGAAGGHARMVTLAPELPGAVELVRRAIAAGVVAAVGHTDATYDQAHRAIDAGATVATHLFNGMRGLHHREPGPVLACLESPRVTCELVADGVHLHPRTVAFAAASSEVALVTDAMGAAGMGDGTYRLGGMDVTVADGIARLANGSTIAGSTLTMDAAVRHAVRDAGLSWPEAARAASLAPARVLGLDAEVGSLAPGKRADLVVFGADLSLAGVMARGEWVVG